MMDKHKLQADKTRYIKTRSTLKIGGKASSKGPKHEVFVAEFVCFKRRYDIHNFIRKNPCKCMLHIC
jgi:hypothetical protein